MATNAAYRNTEWLSIMEAADLIIAAVKSGKHIVYRLVGEPGIAKTAMLPYIANVLGRRPVYVDIPTLEVSDLMMPSLNHDTKTCSYYPNDAHGLHLPDAPMICWDELTKGETPVINAIHPSLTLVNGKLRIGSLILPEGSGIFITGNLESDNVGDKIKAHTLTRVVTVYIRKPYRDEFVRFANGAGFHPVLVNWLERDDLNPFASYTDSDFDSYTPEQKEMVYWPSPANPARNQAYGCPRSYEAASKLLFSFETDPNLSYRQMSAALTGAVGRVCASRLLAFKQYASELPSASAILNDPKGAKLPTSAASQIMAATSALHWVAKEGSNLPAPKTRIEVNQRLDAWFTYADRLGVEVQAYFVNTVRNAADDAARENKTDSSPLAKLWTVMGTNQSFKTWSINKSYVY